MSNDNPIFAPGVAPPKRAGEDSSPMFAPGVQPPSDSPVSFAPGVTAPSASLTPDQQQVKDTVFAMPQYAMSPAGAAGPSVPVLTSGPDFSESGLTQSKLDTIDSEYEKSAKSPFDLLKKIQAKNELAKSKLSTMSPLELAAKPLGWALDKAQKYVGHPAAVMGMKSQLGIPLTPNAAPEQTPDQYGQNINAMTPEEKIKYFPGWGQKSELQSRFQNATPGQDVMPSKSVIPSAAEIAWRRVLSATGGDEMKLGAESEAVGRAQNMDMGHVSVPLFGDLEVAKGVMKGVEMAGELPYYLIGETGIGARVTASEMAKLESRTALMTPKELVSATNAAKRAGAGAEMAAQSSVLASKNNEDVHTAAVEGYVFGNVMELLHSTFTGSKATKGEILSAVNKERASWGDDKLGMVLPPVTWKEYVKGFGEKTGAKSIADMKASAASLKAPDAGVPYQAPISTSTPAIEYAPKQLGPTPRLGSDTAPYSFKTIEYDRSGSLREVRYLDNAKTGKRKKVFDERVTGKYTDPQSGPMVATDGNAFSEYLNLKHPSKETIRQGYGKEAYVSPETADALIKGGTVKPPKEAGPRDNVETKVDKGAEARAKKASRESPNNAASPVLLATDRNGYVKVTTILDRTPDTEGLSPRPIEIGDAVQLADGTPGVVSRIEGDKVTIDRFSHPKLDVSQFDVALADEDLINMSALYGPVTSAEGTSKNLLRLKQLDVKRVMNAAGIDNPVEARAFIAGMEKAGQIEKVNDSLWKVNKSYEPKTLTTPLKDQDHVVYYAADGDRGKSGVLRGRDPKKPGNYLIEVDTGAIGPASPNAVSQAGQYSTPSLPVKPEDIAVGTKLLSIPMDKVKSYAPVLGDISRSQLPAQYGVSTPMPVDAIITSRASQRAVGSYSRMAGQLAKIVSVKDAVKKHLMNLIVHDSWLVPTQFGGRAAAWKTGAQNGVMKGNIERVQSHLATQLGGELSPADQELSKLITLNATRRNGQPSIRDQELQKFFKANPQIGQEAQTTIHTALDHLKQNEATLSQLGVTKVQELESLRAAGLEEEYSMNVYLKHMMIHKDYAAFVKKQMPDEWQRAVNEITKRRGNEYVWQTEDEMLSVLGLSADTGAFKGAPNANTNVKAKLKERLALADEITKILGKLDSASVQIAHSIAATDSMIQRIQTFNDLAKTPYWSPGPRPDLGGINGNGVPVPDHELFGAARGGRMHISFKYLLEQKPAHIEGRSILRSLSSVWKFNQTVGGGMPVWVNNAMRNWKGLVASGGLQAPSDFRTFFDAAEMMLNYGRNPLQYKGSLYEQAMNNGAIGGGFAGSEINKHRAVNRILDAIRKQKGNAKDQWELLANVGGGIRGSAEDVGAMYDGIDRLYKLTAYLNNYRRSISQGMGTDDAHALATMRNRQSFPFYEEIAPTIDKMRGGSISGIAPFLSSKAEDMRVNGTLLMRLKDEPDLQARMLYATATVTAVLGLMGEQRKANGISDDAARQGLDSMKLAQQAFRPMAMIGPSLDSQGRMQVWDMTQWEDLMLMMQHHERDNLPAALFRNLIAGYVGDTTLPGMANNMAFNQLAGVVPLSPLPNMQEHPEESGIMNTLAYLAQNGGIPQALTKVYQAQQNAMPQPTVMGAMQREQWTPEQQMYKIAGAPFAQPIGQKTAVGRVMELKRNLGETQRYIQGIPLTKTPDKQQSLIKANVMKYKEIADEYSQSKK